MLFKDWNISIEFGSGQAFPYIDIEGEGRSEFFNSFVSFFNFNNTRCLKIDQFCESYNQKEKNEWLNFS